MAHFIQANAKLDSEVSNCETIRQRLFHLVAVRGLSACPRDILVAIIPSGRKLAEFQLCDRVDSGLQVLGVRRPGRSVSPAAEPAGRQLPASIFGRS